MKEYTKATMLFLMLVFYLVSTASADTLVWEASPGTVDGYKVYYGTGSGSSKAVDVGNTTQYNIDSLPLSDNTQYYLCVSAYNAAGESDPCPSIAYTPADNTPPLPPEGLEAR